MRSGGELEGQTAENTGELQRRVDQLEAELATCQGDLSAITKELESFTYSVSHDLRAPLRALSGYATILLDEYGDRLDDEGRRMLNRQVDAAGRMEALISDLLEFSRLGRSDMAVTDIDLSRIAEEVGAEVAARSWGVSVRVDVTPGQRLVADARLIRAALNHLLENAVKYSVPKGPVVVEVVPIEGGFGVRDHGIGFDPVHTEKLFEPFERLHRASEFPGTGIGLAIVRKVAARHRGKAWAESTAGVGSTFFVSL